MESIGNQWEQYQREIPALGEVRAPVQVSPELMQQCTSARQALAMCIRMSGYTDESIATKLGVSKGYLSKILSGRAALDGDRRIRLMKIAGNLAPLQYEAQQMGMGLAQQDRASLLAEIDRLRMIASRAA